MDRYAFTRGSEERRTAEVVAVRGGMEIYAGVENLIVLKTKGSAFEGYKKDRYTTLKETRDRILATALTARWTYRSADVPFGACWQQARESILKTFVERESPSVQHTAYAMGEAGFRAGPGIKGNPRRLAHKNYPLVDLAPVGLGK